ncbi:SRPBCC family protein [Streptomyces sp. NPDC007904]|jgi:ribosome-associated toxin RatA of RatAB toxin-antitoxin module|uniref:type II toxin-antitoxin system RatA family toxin n=1 Tax=Streptomyces sp. NPDC007904 TaxID=3364787 RepID=UPI0036E5C530
MAVLHRTVTGPATPDQVWKVLLDVEAFPGFMEGVNEVAVTVEDGDRRRSSWLVELKGSEMEWEQEDVLDHAGRRWEFRQTDGDLAEYEGYWQVTEDPAGVALELKVEFDIGLPMVADMIHPAVARALEGYQQGVLGESA